MTVGTPHLALLHLFQDLLYRAPQADQPGDGAFLLSPDMIKLKDNRVCLTTVHTRMFSKVGEDPHPVPVPVLFAVLVSSAVVVLPVILVVPLRQRALTGLTDVRPNSPSLIPKTELFQSLRNLAFATMLRVHASTVAELRFGIKGTISKRALDPETGGLGWCVKPLQAPYGIDYSVFNPNLDPMARRVSTCLVGARPLRRTEP